MEFTDAHGSFSEERDEPLTGKDGNTPMFMVHFKNEIWTLYLV